MIGVVAALGLSFIPGAKAETLNDVYAYVANVGSGNVSVVDLASNSVIKTITIGVGAGSYDIEASADGRYVYVANALAGSISIIDTNSLTLTATISGIAGPYYLALTPDGSKLYASQPFAGAQISVIDTASRTVTKTISGLAGIPYGLTVSPDGTKLYATNDGGGSGKVFVIDVATDTLSATITPSGGTPVDGAFLGITPDGTRGYLSHIMTLEISVIDLTTRSFLSPVSNWPAGLRSWGLAVNPAGTKLYLANYTNGDVSIVDVASNTWTKTIDLGAGVISAYDVAFSPGGHYAYVPVDGVKRK